MSENTVVKRKQIPKKIRKQVYEKYNGHCAYCGCEIQYKDMQIDHMTPLYWYGGEDNIENYMPACLNVQFLQINIDHRKFS